jgi:isopenicillin-N N-acyltransferase-like protein
MNGLTDLRDVLGWGADLESLGGCTSLIVQRDASADGQVLCGQTWDLATDNMPFVVGVHRRPSCGPETWCVTTVGCLSLIGMNARGIAIGTSNLRTLDARPGVPYLSVIHRALASSTHEEAVAAIRVAVRAGGHSYYVVDREGQAAVVECTATRSRVLPVTSGSHVHTNHCQVLEYAELEADTPKASSRARLDRMRELLRKREGRHDATSLQRCLADEEGGELAICRDDIAGISTNAAIVMSPEEPALWACHGLPSRGSWVDLLRGSSA